MVRRIVNFPMRLVIISLLATASSILFAQERCAQVPYEKMLHPTAARELKFEQWIKEKRDLKHKASANQRTQTGSYTIPVVVHVIHNGEAIGSGTNISDAQIQSQIDVLNRDYRRLNADASNTLAEFLPVAGSMDIQFVLAKQDPEGLATTGIVRVRGTKSGWKLSESSTFKSLSYWRADRYLNIWVINFDDPGGYIGYAQLPEPAGTSLGGLEDASTDSLTDGVTIHYTTFGSASDGSFNLDSRYNKGRTATHEVGHFFGLRHIWGDVNSCTSTDYVDDTPIQDAATRSCPTTTQQSCGHSKMYQNYLDYTDDNCMNLFTVKQVERMDIVINNAVRRKSLLTSPGAIAPVPVANDLGIKSITTPQSLSCFGPLIPSIEIKNYGSNTATTCSAQLKVNGSVVETKNFTISLDPLASTSLNFSSLTLPESSSQVFTIEILSVNGVADAKPANNTLQQTVLTPAAAALPFIELFNTTPANWIIQNPDGLKTWENVSLSGNKAMRMNFYDYENEGAIDRIITPVFDLSSATTALLRFDYAYAPFPGEEDDSFYVLVITDCGANLSNAATLFSKNGSSLATTTSSSNAFTPNSTQWRTVTVSLLPYLGQGKVQFAFVARNGYGNNLYLDNVFVLNNSVNDIALTEVKSPGPVFCISNPQPVLNIKNQGTTVITSFTVETTIDGKTTVDQAFSNIQLLPGEEKAFTLNALSFFAGQSTVLFNIKNPNNLTDDIPENNSVTTNLNLNNATDLIPLRENFDSNFTSAWTIISPPNSLEWQTASTNYNTSLVYHAFTNTGSGQQSWLVSPVLDFSQTTKAGLLFNVSYANRSTGTEQLQLLASEDCGITFDTIIYDRQASGFSSVTSATSWMPKAQGDWFKEFINLNALAGKQNVRLALVVTNENGNNLYLDNLNFYTNDNPDPPQVGMPYFVYASSTLHDEYNITFNLEERADVLFQVYNLMGQKIAEHELPNTLNQTYPIDFTGRSTGVYVIKVQIGNRLSGTKILVNR